MRALEFESCSSFSSALIGKVFKDRKFFVISRSFSVSCRTQNCSNPLVLKENLQLKMIGLVVIYMWWDWKLNYPKESLVEACVCSSLALSWQLILILSFFCNFIFPWSTQVILGCLYLSSFKETKKWNCLINLLCFFILRKAVVNCIKV